MRLSDVRNVAVLGTGTMGPGMVQLFAQAGYRVSMWGRTDASVKRGLDRLRSNLEVFHQNGLLGKKEMELALARVRGCTNLEEAVEGASFVVEAIAEDLSLKKDVFAQLDGTCANGTILCTNTSGLSVTAIASATRRPEEVIATHFWNPPQLVPLVEIVRGRKTSNETAHLATGLMTRIGKVPVQVQKEVPGFIGNRLQFALLREALYIVEEGIATMEDVDTAVKMGFGRRLPVTGPLETVDLGGVDTFLAVSRYLMKDLCCSKEPSPLLMDAVRRGWLGAKSGRGLYERTPEDSGLLAKAREQELIGSLKRDHGKGAK